MISIVIPFCDKDTENVKKTVEKISSFNFDKEIIVVDDRNDKSVDFSIPNCKIIEYSGNKNLFEARRIGYYYSTGEYIWNIDADDDPICPSKDSIKEIEKNIFDIIFFNNYLNGKEQNRIKSNAAYKLGKENNERFFYLYGFGQLWNRIISRNALEKVYDNLPVYDNFFNYEDIFLNTLVFSVSDKICIRNEYIYNYINNKECNPEKGLEDLVKKFSDSEKCFNIKQTSSDSIRIIKIWSLFKKDNIKKEKE